MQTEPRPPPHVFGGFSALRAAKGESSRASGVQSKTASGRRGNGSISRARCSSTRAYRSTASPSRGSGGSGDSREIYLSGRGILRQVRAPLWNQPQSDVAVRRLVKGFQGHAADLGDPGPESSAHLAAVHPGPDFHLGLKGRQGPHAQPGGQGRAFGLVRDPPAAHRPGGQVPQPDNALAGHAADHSRAPSSRPRRGRPARCDLCPRT